LRPSSSFSEDHQDRNKRDNGPLCCVVPIHDVLFLARFRLGFRSSLRIGGDAISFRMIATKVSLSTMTFLSVPVLRLGIWTQSNIRDSYGGQSRVRVLNLGWQWDLGRVLPSVIHDHSFLIFQRSVIQAIPRSYFVAPTASIALSLQRITTPGNRLHCVPSQPIKSIDSVLWS